MTNSINKAGIAGEIIRAPQSLRSAIVWQLLASTMALTGAACSEDALADGPTLGYPEESDSSIDMAGDATRTRNDIIGAERDAGRDTGIDMAIDVTEETADTAENEPETAADTTEEVNDTWPDAQTNETVDAAETEDAAIVAEVQDTNTEPEIVGTDTIDDTDASVDTAIPTTPQEICAAAIADIIATLKPGEPQCAQSIPGVGKVPGKLECSGENLEPNCVVAN